MMMAATAETAARVTRAEERPAEATVPEVAERSAPTTAVPKNEKPDVETGVLPDPVRDVLDYQRDVVERTILFWDTLRQRANNMLEHERAGLPPLLNFKYETLLDARRFEQPASYALLRITEIDNDCWDDCVDLEKSPVIVVDPRAGHGPGIGGFKRESEVGMAMREGHPVYFVIFFASSLLRVGELTAAA